jgi:hypothetical protein
MVSLAPPKSLSPSGTTSTTSDTTTVVPPGYRDHRPRRQVFARWRDLLALVEYTAVQ